MTVWRPTYATREDVKQAMDIKFTAYMDTRVDRAIQDGAERVEGKLHRVFYNELSTRYFDWPNFQSAYPWRIWLDQNELADVDGTVPTVTTGGVEQIAIPAENIFWGPWNYAPPYTYLELDRSTSSAFGQGNTPQRDTWIAGLYGYWTQTTPGGALAAAMSDTTSTSITVTNGIGGGVGDNIMIDTERLLVTAKQMASTGQTQQSGLDSALNNDVALGVSDGTAYSYGETLLLDSERLLVVDIAGDILTVIRAWDGSTIAAHSGATIYGLRQWTVTRGAFGSTAATHADSAPITVNVAPGLIKDYNLAEAVVQLKREGGAFALSQGSGAGKQTGIGDNLADLRAEALTTYGRTARKRVV